MNLLFYNVGAIQIKNWKPLTFDTITENPDATVDEILGDLTSVATLRIKLGRYDTALVWFSEIALHTTITKIIHVLSVNIHAEIFDWTGKLIPYKYNSVRRKY